MPQITVIWYDKYRFDKQCAIAQELFKEIFVVLARMRMSTKKKEEGTHSFIGDFSKLGEEYRIPEGQSGLCRAAKNFRDYLDGVSEKTSVIGYVGPFGTGKSALLEILDPREIFLRSKKEEEKKKEEKVMKGGEEMKEGGEKKEEIKEKIKEESRKGNRKGEEEKSTMVSPPSLRGVSASERADATKQSSFFQRAKEYCKKDNEEWIVFDAWKYPDRGKLWESLLLELAGRPKLKRKWHYWLFDKVPWLFWSSSQFAIKASICGRQKEYQIAFCVGMFLLFGLFFFVPMLFLEEFLFLGYYETFLSFVVRYKEIFQFSLVLLGVFFVYLPSTGLADFQKEFKKLLKRRLGNKNDTLVLVVEDIDRCDDSGVHFLETMHYFLKEYVEKNETFKGKIRVIVPLDEARFHAKSDSYFKCLDLVEFALIPTPDVDAFLKSVLTEEAHKESEPVKELLENLFNKKGKNEIFPEYAAQTTIRKIKLILRNACYRYEQVRKVRPDFVFDWRIIVAVEAARLYNHGLRKDGTFDHECMVFFSGKENVLGEEMESPFRRFLRAYLYNREIPDKINGEKKSIYS